MHWVSAHDVRRDDFSRSAGFGYGGSYRTSSLEGLGGRSSSGIQWHRVTSEPNAECPVCGADVWFIRSRNGGCAYFDALGKPWPLHPCMEHLRRAEDHRLVAEIRGGSSPAATEPSPAAHSLRSTPDRRPPRQSRNIDAMRSAVKPPAVKPARQKAAATAPSSVDKPIHDPEGDVDTALMALGVLLVSLPLSVMAIDALDAVPVWLLVWFIVVPTIVVSLLLTCFLAVRADPGPLRMLGDRTRPLSSIALGVLLSPVVLPVVIVANTVTLGLGLLVLALGMWGNAELDPGEEARKEHPAH